ncbi:type IV pilin N-terminal domain-containing protein [archaeon]|nr:type IV pilin N-terminal domain-containing protein [archaeon]
MKKRGISPLIATVLIVGFTILLAVIIISFIGSEADSQINQTQTTINIHTTNLDFDFECTNIINVTSGENNTELLVINDYNGNLDSVVILFGDGSIYHNAVNLSAFENKLINYTNISSSEIEIIPQVIIDGVLQGLEWEAKTKTCSESILLSTPKCNDTIDNDDDGYGDEDDPDCLDPLTGVYNSSLDNEWITRSCDSCADCESDMKTPSLWSSYDTNEVVLMNDDSVENACITLTITESNSVINCNGKTISDGTVGLNLLGTTNVTVKNCSINDFESGAIMVTGAIDTTLEDIIIIDNIAGLTSQILVSNNPGGYLKLNNIESLNSYPILIWFSSLGSITNLELTNVNSCTATYSDLLCSSPIDPTILTADTSNYFADIGTCGLTAGEHYTTC